MPICSACATTNPPGARFCNNCAAPLAAAPEAREQRKTVTVLFSDITGSTALGERLDPESLRHVMARYFETARGVIERHGGTVEKFIGDAVMAVFGIPLLHEDDALRAVRAAYELRASLDQLNEELVLRYRTRLVVRIGINTGEVVAGTSEALVTGDAVNVAARLEQTAEPGEILLGAETFSLVRNAVDVEPLAARDLKGKTDPVAAYRLLTVRDTGPGADRRMEGEMVGRRRQLKVLEAAFDNAVAEWSCGLFTLLGAAGVGKSRLAAEFLRDTEAQVLRGHCLPYGEGITYFPVVEMIKQLLGRDPDERAKELLAGDEMARTAIRVVLGETFAATTADEIAWAVRKLFETAGQKRPLVAVFDDLHWAEPGLLDLIEHIADFSREAPILLLCLARPELLDRRPGWGGGKLNATTILLEPLTPEETGHLIDQLAGADGFDRELRERIRAAAEGNPLFIEEMLAMVRESGAGEVVVPPTIRALLAARLDQLEASERVVLERAAVEGQSFHRGAVEVLAPEESPVAAKLMRLVRKEMVRPDQSLLPGEEAFRFRHILIRDAAYDSLPKAERAKLHEQFAGWLEERGIDLIERDEIVGYHLEQAFRYRRELGVPEARSQELAAAAAAHLKAAGRRALDRGDLGAAINLLERARALLPSDRPDVSVDLALSWALVWNGRSADARRLMEDSVIQAQAAGDRVGGLRARLRRANLIFDDRELRQRELEAVTEEARLELGRSDDDAALGSLYEAIGWTQHEPGRYGAEAVAMERAAEHARRAGELYFERTCRMMAAGCVGIGPIPAEEALRWLDEAERKSGVYDPYLARHRVELLTCLGRFDEGRALASLTSSQMLERGMHLANARAAHMDYELEMLAGDPVAAERTIRHACEQLEAMGENYWLATRICCLALALTALARYEEAEAYVDRAEQLMPRNDALTATLVNQARSKLAAHAGDFEAAVAFAREGAAVASTMEAPTWHGDALLNFAEVLQQAGQREQAEEQLQRAIEQYEAKGAVAYVSRARERFAALSSHKSGATP